MTSERFQSTETVDVGSVEALWTAFAELEATFLPAILQRGSGQYRHVFEATTERSTVQGESVAAVRAPAERAGMPLQGLRLEVHESTSAAEGTHNAYCHWTAHSLRSAGRVPLQLAVWGPDEAEVLGLLGLAERVVRRVAAETVAMPSTPPPALASSPQPSAARRSSTSKADEPAPASRTWLRSPTFREAVVAGVLASIVGAVLSRVL
jgi:hypothetical protein